MVGSRIHAGPGRETRPGSHVDELSSPRARGGQQGGAVQKVQGHHIRRVRDGGEVHHLVFLQQPPAESPSRSTASGV